MQAAPRVRAPDHGVPASAPPLHRRAGADPARPSAGLERVRRPVPCATGPDRSPGPSACSGGASPPSGWASPTPSVPSPARSAQPPRDLDPEHRRDGVGLFLFGLAVVVAAAVWWQLPGGVMATSPARSSPARSARSAGSSRCCSCFVGWRTLRDPERNGPAGRQVIGWAAFSLGVLGIVHIANGNPQPVLGDTSTLQRGRWSDRLRHLRAAARPAADGVRRGAAAGAAGAVRRPGRHGHAGLPGARRAWRALRDRVLGRSPAEAERRAGRADPPGAHPSRRCSTTRSTPSWATRPTTPRC